MAIFKVGGYIQRGFFFREGGTPFLTLSISPGSITLRTRRNELTFLDSDSVRVSVSAAGLIVFVRGHDKIAFTSLCLPAVIRDVAQETTFNLDNVDSRRVRRIAFWNVSILTLWLSLILAGVVEVIYEMWINGLIIRRP